MLLITPSEFLESQPYIDFDFFILCQPFSTFLVYLASVLTILVGYYFLKTRADEQSRYWLGISLVLGGIGAALAGTSYQAFGYEIKCAGRDYCLWTSWWEILYMICTVLAAGTLLISISYSGFSKKWVKISKIYAILNSIGYIIIILLGNIFDNNLLLSFEIMLLFVFPCYLLTFTLSILYYFSKKQKIMLEIIISCVLLFIALIAYYIYNLLGLTEILWNQGIWFSDNDVLHILMIVWIIYIYKKLGKSMKDETQY